MLRGLRGFDPSAPRTAPSGAGKTPADSTAAASTTDQAVARRRIMVPGAIVFQRPLVSISTAMALIDVDREQQITALIEEGMLRWAFDVANGKGLKREVRILGESINEYLAGQKAPSCSAAEDFARVLDTIFPNLPASLPTRAIARAWSVSGDHVLNLCRSRLLRTVNCSTWHRGPTGAAHIEIGSVIAFLKERRLV